MRVLAVFVCALVLQTPSGPPTVLPAEARRQLQGSLDHSRKFATHIWRDTAPTHADGTVNAYIEIARGDRRKWEYAMGRNLRLIDRVMPKSVGGYPVNYGFVPQSVSYDGDPFDALVLGPAIPGGSVVRGTIVGIMHMEDEKGLDSKVVLSPLDASGRALHELTESERRRVGDFFERYKRHESGKFSKVPGWGSAEAGAAFVRTTHQFFRACQHRPEGPCRLTE